MTAAAVADPEKEQRRAANPAASVWVGASAGTGKTKVLTDRVISLLLQGTPAHRLLCLTFTKAAAAEMANRIAERLGHWATAGDAALEADLTHLLDREPDPETTTRARRLFAQVLDAPDGMKFLTIHAFCQSLLRRFPLEAGIAPHFQVMDERDASELMRAAVEEVLNRAREGADSELGLALAEVTAKVSESGFPDLLADLASARGRMRRMIERQGGLEGAVAALRRRLDLAEGETPDSVLAAACHDSAFDAAACRAAVEALRQGSKSDTERAAIIAAWLADPPARATSLLAYAKAYHTDKGDIRKTLCTKTVLKAAPETEAALSLEAGRLLRVMARWRSACVLSATAALLRLGEALLSAYERHKNARALLDYDDLILTTLKLLARGTAWVLFKLDGGIDHVLIDEAQDTNPEQWAVVKAITGEFFSGGGARGDSLRTVFAVGDGKQSIYSFQGADPRAFEEMRELFRALVPQAEARWEEVDLFTSFRSTAAVLRAVDQVFKAAPGRDGVVPAGQDYIHHVPFRTGQAGLVEVWPPLRPRPQDQPEPWKPPVERVKGDSPRGRLARLTARKIHHLLQHETLESQGRKIRAGDIMVLVRRRNAFVEELVRELKSLGVPVTGADRMVLAEQMAVMDLVALGNVMLLPDDDLTLATVLKGPLFGLDEDQLFRLAHDRGKRATLWEALKGSEEFAWICTELRSLLAIADRLRPHEFYAEILGPRGGRTKLLRRLGWEAEDPIDEFMGLTLGYERTHAPSLQGFLHWLEAGAVEVKRDLEQSTIEAVRIITVHGSKGLQAPIVFLPDTLQAPQQIPRLLWAGGREDEVMLWVPRADLFDPLGEQARDVAKLGRDREYRRLLYVAMTRAEDRLYVCGWETRRSAPDECWYHLIHGAVAAIADPVEDPFLTLQGEETTEVLRLTCPQTMPARAGKAAAARPAAEALPAWIFEKAPGEPTPPQPLMPSRPEGDEPPVRSPLSGEDGSRFKRGRLIHRLLQSLPDLPLSERAAAAARFLARPAWGLSPAEQEAFAVETLKVLGHEEFSAIFGPGSQAEVPVVGRVGDRVVSGQVDRLLVTDSEVLVVDYKTNRPPPRLLEEVAPVYLKQMAAYRAALACVYPGRDVRCALLWTDGPVLMPLPGV